MACILRGSFRTVRRTASDIMFRLHKKLAHLDLPHMSQEECVPRGVGKVSPYFVVGGSIFRLGFTQFDGFATILQHCLALVLHVLRLFTKQRKSPTTRARRPVLPVSVLALRLVCRLLSLTERVAFVERGPCAKGPDIVS